MSDNFEIIRGRIENLQVKRANNNFLFSVSDINAMGVTAVLASVAGLDGQAVSLSSSSSDASEAADYLEFEIAGKLIKGWVWRNPFNEGDEVEAVVEKKKNCYITYAVVRPTDRIIALYPHCSRGEKAYKREAVRSWKKESKIMTPIVFLFFMLAGFFSNGGITGVGALFVFLFSITFVPLILAYVGWRVTSRFKGFVRLAERIFSALGWEHPEEIDLPKCRVQRVRGKDPIEFGLYYYRY